MTIHSINGYEVSLVNTPEGQKYFALYGNMYQQWLQWNEMTSPGVFKPVRIKLSPGTWSILGSSTAEKCTEEEAKGIVERNGEGWEHYMTDEQADSKDYIYALPSALESLHSFIRSHSMKPENTVVVYRKKNNYGK